jgi:phenylpropionate dioxygenase-like ring-hydroxylating dioxygenase large terminal subunit
MDHSTQVRLIRQALAAIDRGSPPLAERPTRNSASAYTSHERAAREREMLFRRMPIVVGLSAQIPAAGDYLTEDLTPVPILVVRREDRSLAAFANICRHRGARLARGCGNAGGRFVCPYHAWTYDFSGNLAAIPDDYGFEGIDIAAHGLMSLPVAERHGLIFASMTPGEPFDAASMFAKLDSEIEGYGIGAMRHFESRTITRRMNWKLMSDTFWEAYHIKALHRDNIAPLFVRNLALFEPMGRNHRLAGIRKSIEKLRSVPEADWSIIPHATILMNIFPNTVLVMQSDHIEVYRIYPDHERVGQASVVVSILAPPESTPAKWTRAMELILGVVEQDFELGESIQRDFESGAIRHVNYGRYEAALEHFHANIRDALGESSH